MKLHPQRCYEIAAADFFMCHKTVNHEELEDEDEEVGFEEGDPRPLRDGEQACTGWICLRHKEDINGVRRIPQMIQIAERIGILDTEKIIARNADSVFDTVDDMADHSRDQ